MRSPKQGLIVSAKRLLVLERSGRYEEALELFGTEWEDEEFLPRGENSEIDDEMLLRLGALVGFHGYKYGSAAAQERSKNLITLARDTYIRAGNDEKINECENYLALAYWRTGETREALAWIDTALERDVPPNSEGRLYAEVIRSMIFLAIGRIDENIKNCLSVEGLMRAYGNAFLNGCLATNLALSFKRASKNAEAMQYLDLARHFHERSRHKTYLGTVHNNLAQTYKAERKFVSAHESADAAIRIYRKIKDRSREASSWDTKAQIYLEERKFDEALKAADKSIKMLINNAGAALLAESYLTKAKILLFADRFADAILSLLECVNITKTQDGEAAAKLHIDDFCRAIDESRQDLPAPAAIASDELELVLPGSISGYPDYKGVWINTDKLELAGISRGSLAIVVPSEVRRGDLAAILELKNNVVSCGYYDSEFGIICLLGSDNEPELFDENEVKVIGKIVGVCRTGKDPDGKMTVEAITP